MSTQYQEFFEPPQLPTFSQIEPDLEKIHYGINLGAAPINANKYYFGQIPRGRIFPIFDWGEWKPNADYTGAGAPGTIVDNARESIWEKQLPGIMAQALERDYQTLGLRILRTATKLPLNAVKDASLIFVFQDLDEWQNHKILEFLGKYITNKKNPHVELAEDLMRHLNVVQGYQVQHMAWCKAMIDKKFKGSLDKADLAICKAINRSPADYQVDEVARRKADQESVLDMFREFFTAAKEVEGESKNAEVLAFMKEQAERSRQQDETIKKLQKTVDDLRKGVKSE